MEYTLLRSNRRSVSIEITREATVVVRAPRHFPKSAIEALITEHTPRIEARLKEVKSRLPAFAQIEEKQQALTARAKAELPPLVERYARQMGLTPKSVRITGAKTRFGSCSGQNGLCFSWRLMAYPDAAIEYVVVHELAHIRHKNHSLAFHQLIEHYLPDHRERRALLKQPPPLIKEETL